MIRNILPTQTKSLPMTGLKRKRRSQHSVQATVLAAILGLVFIVPALWILVGSLRPSSEIFDSLYPLSWDILVPSSISLDNYFGLWSTGFGTALLNSLIVCLVSVVLGVALCALAAYALGVLNFPGRGFVFAFVVIGFMVPFEAIAIPLSQQFSEWSLSNSLAGLILPGIGNGLAIFNLRQHFLSVPESFREAAKLDGASEFLVLRSIYIPISGAALTNSALLIFLAQWTSYLWPLLVVSDESLQVAPVALAKTFAEHASNFGHNFAGAVLLSLVPAVLMFILQKSSGGLSISSGEK
jgi:ABC-type glycerol-3-phosphate transport system permease component